MPQFGTPAPVTTLTQKYGPKPEYLGKQWDYCPCCNGMVKPVWRITVRSWYDDVLINMPCCAACAEAVTAFVEGL